MYRVLFVVTGNKGRLSFVFANQLESLVPHLEEYRIVQVMGKGVRGYLSNLKPLRKAIREFRPDLIHAHYSQCGYLASLSMFRPIVVSLMGSDCRGAITVLLNRLFHLLGWSFSIVKSQEMLNILKLGKRVKLIPNGVDSSKFPFIPRVEACQAVSFDPGDKNVLFIANPQRPEKNFPLAREAVESIHDPRVKLHVLTEIPHERINAYMRAADALILTSLHEGSPNVIKEAMACGLPIVSTDVGDVRENLRGLQGCYVTGFTVDEVRDSLRAALDFEGSTNGPTRFRELGLESGRVRDEILRVYASVAGRS